MSGGGSAATAFNQQPQDIRCALISNAPPGTQDASAAVSLADTIATGGIPTQAEIVAGVSGIATLIGGPAAGLAIGAAAIGVATVEDAVQAIFIALGWGPKYLPSYTYCGVQRTIDPKPWGPGDPNWIPLATMQDIGAVLGLQWGPNPHGLPGGRPSYNPSSEPPFDMYAVGTAKTVIYMTTMTPTERWQWDNGSWQGGTWLPSPSQPPQGALDTTPQYQQLSPFETYVATLWLANIALWANCQPFINPQDLVIAAASVWNGKHVGPFSASNSAPCSGGVVPNGVCYSAAPNSGWQPMLPWDPANNSFITQILGPFGDSTNQKRQSPPLGVNTGPAFKSSLPPGPVQILPTGRPGLWSRIGTILFDPGYFSQKNIEVPGPDRLIGTGGGWKDATPQRAPGCDHDDPRDQMAHHLSTRQGRDLYRRRAPVSEGGFAELKDAMGLRRFSLRGLPKVNGELLLAATAANLRLLHRRAPHPA